MLFFKKAQEMKIQAIYGLSTTLYYELHTNETLIESKNICLGRPYTSATMHVQQRSFMFYS